LLARHQPGPDQRDGLGCRRRVRPSPKRPFEPVAALAALGLRPPELSQRPSEP
jgi:hypothetical protein